MRLPTFLYVWKERLERFIAWTPVIWRDRDWDWAYLFDIMEFKMRRMARVMESGYHALGPADAKNLRLCADLLKRLREDDFAKELYDEWHAMQPEKRWDEGGRFLTNRSPEAQRLFKAAMDLEERQRKAAEDVFFKTFRRQYRSWWT